MTADRNTSHLVWLDTRMGVERSLLAALQAAVAMIGLGFTLVRFLEQARSDVSPDKLYLSLDVPRIVGLTLIAVGGISLAVFTFQYHRARKYLSSEPYREISGRIGRAGRAIMYAMSGTVMAIGCFAFVSLLVRF